MAYLLIILALLIGVLDWIAIARGLKKVEYFATPAVMVCLLGFLLLSGGLSFPLIFFTLGIIFSLVGDVSLMLPKERLTIGVMAFLLVHLCYLVGFNTTPPPLNAPSLILTVMLAFIGVWLYQQISKSLDAKGQGGLKGQVMTYSMVIILMLLSALLTLVRPQDEWKTLPALLVSAGALSFFTSDVLQAWTKYVQPLPKVRNLIMPAYHIGQVLIVLGAALNFS